LIQHFNKYTTERVLSADGTTIVYRKLGAGPGVILVHGGLMAAQDLMKLGEELSPNYTVYITNRRGRGGSGPHGNDHTLEKEREDIQAIAYKTNAPYIFGLSAGAIITLYAASKDARFKKIAVYEPPFPVSSDYPVWLKRYDAAMAGQDLPAAFLHVVKGLSDRSFIHYLPNFILKIPIRMAMKGEKRKDPDHVLLKELVPTMHYDAQMVMRSGKIVDQLKDIKGDLLLMNGTKSRQALHDAIALLRQPGIRRTEFSGQGHLAATNGGKPKLVAEELRKFFS
jgi:pimeloyl-ACP methyl ester carboxylesterase